MAGGRGSPGRLVIVVVVVVAAVTAALATVVFLLVRDARLNDSLERARADAVFDLRLAGSLLQRSADPQEAVETFQRERGVHAILVQDGQTYDPDPGSGVVVPADLRAITADGQIGYDRIDVGGTPTLLVGGPTPDRGAELYLAFPEVGINEDLRELATALAIGWVAIAVVAFALARVASGRIATLAEAEAWGRRFTSDVSHELRTPVAALVSEASVLQEHVDEMPPDARRAAELLVGDVARLRRLVEDLTSLASLDAGRAQVRAEPFNLAALVDATVRSRGWDGRVEIRAEPFTVSSDRTRVDRIVANLIGNALDHGGGHAVIDVGRGEDGPFVQVTDTGPGIAPEHLDHVFDRFFRADPSRSGPGTGLGLAIARENARLLGGEVEAQSEPGAGSRFTLHLPDVVAEP